MNRDPSRSAKLRKQGRAVVAKKVHALHQSLRNALQDNDVIGLRKTEVTRTAFINWEESASAKLERAQMAIEQLIEHWLLRPWAGDLVERSVQRGIEQVEQELQTTLGHLDSGDVSGLHAHAAALEVRGIADETQRRMLRLVVRALEIEAKPEALMKEMRAVLDKVTKLRLNTLVNTNVVRAVNAGKLFGYQASGIEMVGVDPEWVPRVHVHDAKKKRKRQRRKKSPEEVILEVLLGTGFNPVPEAAEIMELAFEKIPEVAEILNEAFPEEEEEMVNILTAGDNLVCEDCEDIAADGPYPISEARDLIPAHPNCRCAFVPFGDERYAPIMEQEEDW